MRFPENLKRLSIAMGCSQNELAKIMNVDRSTVTYWECGRTIPDLRTAKMVSLVLGVSLDELTD